MRCSCTEVVGKKEHRAPRVGNETANRADRGGAAGAKGSVIVIRNTLVTHINQIYSEILYQTITTL